MWEAGVCYGSMGKDRDAKVCRLRHPKLRILYTRPRDGVTDVSEMIAKIALAVFSWMAQKETEERKRRQRGGIEAAKREGKYKGRKPVQVDPDRFSHLLEEVRRGERTNNYV